jgi:tRNA pseudouridine55 synthase
MNFLLINKPEGWTSFDVVAFVRKQANCHPEFISRSMGTLKQIQRGKRLRVGHAGTLDPFATGLLIIGVGREATKRLDEFKNMPKTYVATIKLGEISDTYDKTGKITGYKPRTMDCKPPTISEVWASPHISFARSGKKNKFSFLSFDLEIKKIVKSFVGKQTQVPPMFSAKKINGRRLYELARKGIEVERKANAIEIYKIKILDYSWPFLKIEVQCSAGTYIRSLAHDIGKKAGTGAYCMELIRTKIGKYSLIGAVTPSLITRFIKLKFYDQTRCRPAGSVNY